jgi:hypothetical protein
LESSRDSLVLRHLDYPVTQETSRKAFRLPQ